MGLIDRRTFLAVTTGSLFLASLATPAQQPRKIPVVGFLTTGGNDSLDQFREAMRDLGQVEGQSFVIERRSADGRPDAMPRLAAELVGSHVNVLYAAGPAAVRAARDATSTIPIVALDLETDPVESRLVASMGRPGGNVTGLFLDLPELAGKWLEILQQVAPEQRRIGALWDATTTPGQLNAAKSAATHLGIDLQVLEFRNTDGVEPAVKAGMNAGIRAIVILSSPIVSASSKRLAQLMTRNRVPAICPFRAFADEGGLLAYGPNLRVFRRFAATYVNKVLRGEKVADLPIQQPAKFEFVVNLTAARAIGVTIPQALLLRADEVIQ